MTLFRLLPAEVCFSNYESLPEIYGLCAGLSSSTTEVYL
jgi:hypothetical protein